MTAEKLPRHGGRRKDVFGLHLKAELRQVADDASKRTTGRVGDELQGNLRRPNFPDRIERARQNRATDIHNAVEVEQHASYFMDATHGNLDLATQLGCGSRFGFAQRRDLDEQRRGIDVRMIIRQ